MNAVDLFVRFLLDRYLNASERMLDIGCGPAPYKEWVSGLYVGLDITDAPYGSAPRRVDVVGSAMELPIGSDAIDLVFSKSAFFLVPSPDAALGEFLRVLKPGGRVLLLDYNRRTQQKLQSAENIARPCWTQWQLQEKLKSAGFRECELLVPVAREVGRFEYLMRLYHQEFFGTWAIVTAVK